MFPKPSRASLGSLDKQSDYILPIGKGLSCTISVLKLDLVLPQPILNDCKQEKMHENFKKSDDESTDKLQTIVILSLVCCPFSPPSSALQTDQECSSKLEEQEALISNSTDESNSSMPKF